MIRRRLLTAGEIAARREEAADRWQCRIREHGLPDAVVPHRAPGYFADRFAFARAWRPARHPGAEPPGFDVEAAVAHRDAIQAQRHASEPAIEGWALGLDAPISPGPLWAELRERWSGFCARHGIAAELDDVSRLTWREQFGRTVFRPRPPVFVGPHHVVRLDAADRARIRDAHGPRGAVDFFTMMLGVHETLHAGQLGEPLFNEIVQAALWMRFLDEEDLWLHQRRILAAGDSERWVRRQAADMALALR